MVFRQNSSYVELGSYEGVLLGSWGTGLWQADLEIHWRSEAWVKWQADASQVLHLLCLHSIMAIFQKSISILEKDSTNATELFDLMSDVRSQLIDRAKDEFFGYLVNRALSHLPREAQEKFRNEAKTMYNWAVAYLEKWFSFKDSPFKSFSCLNFKEVPAFHDLMKLQDLLKLSAAIVMDGDDLYREFCLLRTAALQSCQTYW